ncbi:DUF4870 domain-containing protein [Rothia sp. 11273D007AR]
MNNNINDNNLYGDLGSQKNPYMPPSEAIVNNNISPEEILVEKINRIKLAPIAWGALGFLPPLIYWLRYKNNPEFQAVRKNAADTFNFTICVALILFLLNILLLVGPLLALPVILWQWVEIYKCYQLSKSGKEIAYPIKIPILS